MQNSEILDQFKIECQKILEGLHQTLKTVKADLGQSQKLEEFGQLVDRMMGGARNLATGLSDHHPLCRMAECASLCKTISYKAANVVDNAQVLQTAIAFLEDALEFLEHCQKLQIEKKMQVPDRDIHMLKRLSWFVENFDQVKSETKDTSLEQGDIDDMMKKWGLD